MNDILHVEKAYLQDNQAELAKRYPGKYLLLEKEVVLGSYDSHDDAIDAAVSLGTGPFLVRSVHRPEDDEPLVIPDLSLGIL